MIKHSTPSRSIWPVLGLLLGGFGLRLWDLTRQNIWWDEARNIDVALRPFVQIPTAPELDIHPPIYFWLLHGWLRNLGIELGQDPTVISFATRFVSVAAAILGMLLLYRLTVTLADERAGRVALLLAALSPFWLAEAQEARMYTVGFVFLTAGALALVKAEGRSRPPQQAGDPQSPAQSGRTKRATILLYGAFVLTSALALLTHYNALFVVVAWYLWWGTRALMGPAPWSRLRVLLGCGVGMSLLILPILPVALGQIPDYANPNLTVPSLGQYLWENWQGYLGGYAWPHGLAGQLWLWSILGLGGAGLILRRAGRGEGFLLAWLLGGLAFYYIAVLDRGAFNIRYASFVTPALYALLGIGLSRWGGGWRLWAISGLIAGGMIPGVVADLTDARFFRSDTAGVAAWLQEVAGPGDVILVDQKYPFGFYYDAYAIEPEETHTGREAAPARYLFVDINTVDQALIRWAGQAETIFWVEWFESDTDPRGAVPFLLDSYGQRQGEQPFQGYRVTWWRMAPPTAFTLTQALTPTSQRWGIGLEAIAADVAAQAQPGGFLPVVIRWQRWGEPVPITFKARVALYDAAGNRLAQDDRRLLNDRHLQPDQWATEDQPLNVYGLHLPQDLPPGAYTVQLLLYDEASLAPFELMDAAANPAGFETVIGFIEIR
jgi:hypothetical protein